MDKTTAARPRIIQVVGYKNTGKTTMTAALITGLSAKGFNVAAIKHDGHDHFEMDHEGTDSYQFGRAGAAAVAVMSQKRTAIIKQQSTGLEDMLSQFTDYDWIVIEGFKDAPYPKLVMVREAGDLPLAGQLQHVAGIVFWLPELLEQTKEKLGEDGGIRGEQENNIRETAAVAKFLSSEHEAIIETVLELG